MYLLASPTSLPLLILNVLPLWVESHYGLWKVDKLILKIWDTTNITFLLESGAFHWNTACSEQTLIFCFHKLSKGFQVGYVKCRCQSASAPGHAEKNGCGSELSALGFLTDLPTRETKQEGGECFSQTAFPFRFIRTSQKPLENQVFSRRNKFTSAAIGPGIEFCRSISVSSTEGQRYVSDGRVARAKVMWRPQ